MSIELAADIVGCGDFNPTIHRALRKDPEVQILASPDASVIRLRFSENPVRKQWSEDVQVTLEDGRILVVLYSATRRQREHLTRLLERALAEAGCSGEFVEE